MPPDEHPRVAPRSGVLLIVPDDDERMLLWIALYSAGMTVRSCASVRQARARLLTFSPDACAYRVSGEPGAASAQLRELRDLRPDMHLVAMGSAGERRPISPRAFETFLEIPFFPHQLVATIRKSLTVRHAPVCRAARSHV